MAFGPLYTDLPLAAATATRPATRYVDETSWNALIGSFSLWGDNVNANGKNLSNVDVLTATSIRMNSATARGNLDVNGVITFSENANLQGVDFTDSAWTVPGGGAIGWNKVVGQGEFSLISISQSGLLGGFSFWDRNTILMRIMKSGTVGIGTLSPHALLHLHGTNVGGVDAIEGIMLDRLYTSVGDSMNIVWGAGSGMTGNKTGRLSMNAIGGGEAAFIFYAQTAAGDGYSNEIMRMQGNGLIKTRILMAETNGGSTSLDASGHLPGQWYTLSPDNTTLRFRMRGSDGVWRQASLTLT